MRMLANECQIRPEVQGGYMRMLQWMIGVTRLDFVRDCDTCQKVPEDAYNACREHNAEQQTVVTRSYNNSKVILDQDCTRKRDALLRKTMKMRKRGVDEWLQNDSV